MTTFGHINYLIETECGWAPFCFCSLQPIFTHTVTGTGGTEDPYVWTIVFEVTDFEVTENNIPLKDDTIACFINPDPRRTNTVFLGDRDLGHNNLYVEVPPVLVTPDVTPSTMMSEASLLNTQTIFAIILLTQIELLV